MFGRMLISLTVLATGVCSTRLCAQDTPAAFNFNIGGGISQPMNPTGRYAGTSGNFDVGGGYNINRRNSINGEFMWSGLPPSIFVLHPLNAPDGSVNLYSLTANYRFHLDRLGHSPFGVYAIAGGGWYYRYAKLTKDYVVYPGTPCQPAYNWWGYSCDSGYEETLASKGSSAPGVNGGMGFTIRISDSDLRFYVESRYHYAWHSNVKTAVLPITFGFRLN